MRQRLGSIHLHALLQHFAATGLNSMLKDRPMQLHSLHARVRRAGVCEGRLTAELRIGLLKQGGVQRVPTLVASQVRASSHACGGVWMRMRRCWALPCDTTLPQECRVGHKDKGWVYLVHSPVISCHGERCSLNEIVDSMVG